MTATTHTIEIIKGDNVNDWNIFDVTFSGWPIWENDGLPVKRGQFIPKKEAVLTYAACPEIEWYKDLYTPEENQAIAAYLDANFAAVESDICKAFESNCFAI
jgi:hypothetical protein